MWRDDIKCKYMFMFTLENLAPKGLMDLTPLRGRALHWRLPFWQLLLQPSNDRFVCQCDEVSVSVVVPAISAPVFMHWHVFTKDHFGYYGLNQWEMMLQRNIVFHWLSPYPDWSLFYYHDVILHYRLPCHVSVYWLRYLSRPSGQYILL